MNRRNYQKELEETIAMEAGRIPRLLLHSCCAPCSSYVMEYLSRYFEITVYFYNPNIYPPEEFSRRLEEEKRLIGAMEFDHPVRLTEAGFDPEEFCRAVRGFEGEREGGERCRRCFALRLRETARAAAKGGFEYFTTTLSISPQKNAVWLNEIGEAAGREWGVKYLNSDFKKKDGYKRSIQLSCQYGLYRQDYCGCVHSRNQRDQAPEEREMKIRESIDKR